MWWCALALAQTPASDWKTVRTEHFRVHYPAEAASWAEGAAGRIEALHARVVEEVGYLPPRVIDVVIRDPYSVANGMALPFLGAPRIELWTSPPEAGSVIGDRRAWDELLLVHEDTHLVHMTRPSRNPVSSAIGAILGWGPITRKSPAWVVEGYATVVEGRLTGSGRPNGAFRESLLRVLGRAGRMPTYRELDWSGAWIGGSYRYLVGSAFLEWLEAEVGPSVGASEHSLRDLWARMSARKTRSFDEAFRGVYRDSPQVLYDRFAALVEARAALAPRGEDWVLLEHPWAASRPTLDADGGRIAAVAGFRRGPPALMVWDTAFDRKAEEDWDQKADEIAARDPEDVPAVRPWAFPPIEVARMARWIAAPEEPVFEPGGSVLYSAWAPDSQGRWRPDLYRWDPARHRPQRLTRGEDLRAPEPSADGTWCAALRERWGITEIVRVDLLTGAVTTLVPATPGVDVDRPRLGPADQLAWLAASGDGWTPVIQGVGPLAVHDVIDLTWSPEGELYGVCGEASGFDACRLPPETALDTQHRGVTGVEVAAAGKQ
jgi:hypothetical protein